MQATVSQREEGGKREREGKREVKCLIHSQTEAKGRETGDIGSKKYALMNGGIHFKTKTQSWTFCNHEV